MEEVAARKAKETLSAIQNISTTAVPADTRINRRKNNGCRYADTIDRNNQTITRCCQKADGSLDSFTFSMAGEGKIVVFQRAADGTEITRTISSHDPAWTTWQPHLQNAENAYNHIASGTGSMRNALRNRVESTRIQDIQAMQAVI